jgi:hypothetical protein
MNEFITAGDFLAGGGGVTEAMNQIERMKVKLFWILKNETKSWKLKLKKLGLKNLSKFQLTT